MIKKLSVANNDVCGSITESLLTNKFADNSCVTALVNVAEGAIDKDLHLFKSAVP
jgi:hypothetical protein